MVDSEGIHPLPDKVDTVQEAPDPRNVRELKAYLCLVSYYSKFLPKLSMVLAPLYNYLLKKKTHWRWMAEEKEAFQQSKELLISSHLLVNFDPTLPLVLACDVSQYEVGAVLAHRLPDESERPIGYARRSLSESERNYSQLDKKSTLMCVWSEEIPCLPLWTLIQAHHRCK